MRSVSSSPPFPVFAENLVFPVVVLLVQVFVALSAISPRNVSGSASTASLLHFKTRLTLSFLISFTSVTPCGRPPRVFIQETPFLLLPPKPSPGLINFKSDYSRGLERFEWIKLQLHRLNGRHDHE
jgi:hypothetical protein